MTHRPDPLELADDVDELPPFVGQRVRQLRKLRGLTQHELADLASLSPSLVAKVEGGRRPASPVFVTAAARALRVPVTRLLTQPDPEASDADRRAHAGVEPVRLELLRHRLPVDPDEAPPARPLTELTAELERGLRLRHASRLGELGELLPGLLLELRAAARRGRSRGDSGRGDSVAGDSGGEHSGSGDSGGEAYRLLALGYDLAIVYAGQLAHVDLGIIAADRLAWAAERAGDQLLHHLAGWRSGMHLLYAGDYRGVEQLTSAGLAELEPATRAGGPEPLSLWGQLHLQAGLAAVRSGRASLGETHLAAARDAAERLGGDRDDFGLAFGPTNVALWAVSLALSADDAPRALALADRVALPAGMQAIRKADYWVDVAGAQLMNGSYDASLQALVSARQASPESIRARPAVREIVAQLVRTRRRLPDPLRSYAAWAGVLV